MRARLLMIRLAVLALALALPALAAAPALAFAPARTTAPARMTAPARTTAPAVAPLYPVGQREATLSRPGGSTFTVLLLYPAVSAGADAAFDPSGGPYPALSFGHGWMQPARNYLDTLRFLAARGYIVAAPLSGMEFAPDAAAFAGDLWLAHTYLDAENARPGSPFYQGVNTGAYGVFGHSMGGGAAGLCAADHPRIRAVASLAAAETMPASVAAAAQRIHAPVRLLAGSADAIAPVDSNQRAIYAASNPPRQLAILQGAGHCGFMDSATCDMGMGVTLPRAEQLAITRAWLVDWFDYSLKNDALAAARVWGTGLHADPRVLVEAEDLGVKFFIPLVVQTGQGPGIGE